MSAKHSKQISSILALALLIPAGLFSQTKIEAPNNRYDPSDDVKLGREAAAEVEREFPILRDGRVQDFIDSIGQRLVPAIPVEFGHPEFDYRFTVVNASDINAFALPGGPLYFNRGMIEAAATEAEVASVMAHEMAHVALRHGTAQATAATKYQLGEIAGAILGEIVGGTAGSIITQGSRFGLGAAFMRFSREHEKQADLLGARMMADAGYDPAAMASMFRTIAERTGRSGPEWLSDHPDPGNRSEYITEEARALRHSGRPAVGGLEQVQARLDSLPDAPTTEEIVEQAEGRRGQAEGRRGQAGAVGTAGARGRGSLGTAVEPPASDFERHAIGDILSVSVPSNWVELQGPHTVRFAPRGAFSEQRGRQAFTHGIEIGSVGVRTANLVEASDALVEAIRANNPELAVVQPAEQARFAGRPGLRVRLTQPSMAGGAEIVTIHTALVEERMFYSISVAPEKDYDAYRATFERVNESIRIGR